MTGFKHTIGILLVFALAGCSENSGGEGQPATANVALSGIIDIEAGTRVDRDNADALQFFGAAGSMEGSQSLPGEFLLAGYVSGSSDSYPTSGGPAFHYFLDAADHYTLPFGPEFEISLQVFKTRANATSDVTLKLADNNGTPVATKTANQSGARVSISSTGITEGRYHLSVESMGTAPMLYILSAQRVESSLARSFHWPAFDYVPGEAIVSLKTQAQTSSLPQAFVARSMMQGQVGRELAPGVWALKQPATASRLSAHKAVDTMAWIKTLRKDPAVNWASPNYRTHALNTPVNEPLYSASVLGQQWHYSLINGPIAWQLAPNGGAGIKVAVVDTGLFYNKATDTWHSDLSGNVVPGYDVVNGGRAEDPGNTVGGSVFHGTHVAGTIAAMVNGRGGGGVAFKSKVVPVRVLGEGGTGTLADLIDAMEWIVGLGSSASKADIVNLSLGGLPCNDPAVSGSAYGSLQSFINIGAITKSMLFVAAAGNSATSDPTCPAKLDNVFSVSATDGAGKLASYSNFGPTIDIAAPGGDASRGSSGNSQGDLVSSTGAAVVDGELIEVYLGLQGTSMAAPHFSGVLALMKAAKPSLSYSDVRGYLNNGDLTAPPCDFPCQRTDKLGFGLLDGGKAMQSVLSGSTPELMTASPAVVSLATEVGQVGVSTVIISPLGNYNATIENVSTSDSWFSVVSDVSLPLTIDTADQSHTNDALNIELALNTENMNPGVSYRGTLSVTYSSGTESSSVLTVPVIGQQITDWQARDAGRHFVLLVDPEPEPGEEVYNTVAQTIVVAKSGQYQFTFLPDDGALPKQLNEVPPGRYILVAGTDLDNDGLICHAGEACAEYPVSGLRQEIVIEEGRPVEGIRMTTSYSRPSLSSASIWQSPGVNFPGYQVLSANPDSVQLKAVAP